MSTTQEQVIAIPQEEYISWSKDWTSVVPAEEVSARDKLLDTNVKCLLALGGIPIVVGLATGIWPVALVGLGPWFLAWLDTNQRRRERKH